MKLRLERKIQLEHCTIGHLFVDDRFECFTLEDPEREVKVPGDTAIPGGMYKVIIDFSQHFQKDLPHILDVPGFEGVRIHPGNTDQDTEGCVLVGKAWYGGDFIGRSREAFDSLFSQLKEAHEITLEVV